MSATTVTRCPVSVFQLHHNLAQFQHIVRRQFCVSCYYRSAAKPQQSYYQDLDVDPQASSREIKEAFYKLSKEYHPDRNVDNPDALKRFQAISEAYELLSNPQKRIKYDKGVLGRNSSVAEREASSHRFEGETFYGSRGNKKLHRSADIDRNLDRWVVENRKASFERQRDFKQLRRDYEQFDSRFAGVSSRSAHDKSYHASNWHGNKKTDGKIYFFCCFVFVAYIALKVIF